MIHGYDTVDDRIVWDAIKSHVPSLLEWLEDFDI
ncbi:MAG: HepT-like ribonuclease domain-containing protein [Candidatus Brocadiia bacterium]